MTNNQKYRIIDGLKDNAHFEEIEIEPTKSIIMDTEIKVRWIRYSNYANTIIIMIEGKFRIEWDKDKYAFIRPAK